jgi:hypothetical protein
MLATPEEPDNPLKPNRYCRLTEERLPAWRREPPEEGAPPRPQLLITMPPLGNVFDDLINIVIDPRQVQDLLG